MTSVKSTSFLSAPPFWQLIIMDDSMYPSLLCAQCEQGHFCIGINKKIKNNINHTYAFELQYDDGLVSGQLYSELNKHPSLAWPYFYLLIWLLCFYPKQLTSKAESNARTEYLKNKIKCTQFSTHPLNSYVLPDACFFILCTGQRWETSTIILFMYLSQSFSYLYFTYFLHFKRKSPSSTHYTFKHHYISRLSYICKAIH